MREQGIAGGFPPPGSSPSPSAAAISGSFLRLGIVSFGGPAMIAHIKEMSVIRNKWLTEETFKDGVVIFQSVPGATAMQMAAYVGLRAKGVRGSDGTLEKNRGTWSWPPSPPHCSGSA